MHKIKKLKENLLEELGEYSDKKGFDMNDLACIKQIASAVDHMCNIVKDAEEEEYSERSYRSGRSYRRSYDDGMSRGRSYGMDDDYDERSYEGGSSYARGRGRSARRDSMGRYSGEDYSGDPEEIARHIRTIAMSAEDDDIRNELERLAKKIPKM